MGEMQDIHSLHSRGIDDAVGLFALLDDNITIVTLRLGSETTI